MVVDRIDAVIGYPSQQHPIQQPIVLAIRVAHYPSFGDSHYLFCTRPLMIVSWLKFILLLVAWLLA